MADIVGSMRVFARVVETGSFTAVAKENDVTAAQISRAVTALEEQLQTALLHRTTRHLSLTEAGSRFYERAKAILADLDAAADEARNASVSPVGKVRVHCAPGLAQSTVAAALVSYQRAYPDVSVELKIEQSMPNLVEDGYDVSLISATHLPDSAYVAQSLGAGWALMVASPDYVKQHGMPLTADDLPAHTLLKLESPVAPPDEWHLESTEHVHVLTLTHAPLQVNAPDVLRAMLLGGAGIGTLATYTAVEDLVAGTLVRVLPQYRLRPFTVYAVYPSRRYLEAKVRTLLDHLRATLTPALEEAIDRIEALNLTVEHAAKRA
ncbi:LysR family transcriptional regulator [Burkholderia sp. Ac-20365]|uniref:LysR family transcriptional regulator n=1 Tax=Burkholderia sp. Ac-20365 TaxID=2703897 RepID=UPI00197B73A4|nr:LysR family transcriptional regulator [Burkholderia sp. Ac-20365]MBN3767880.1 LysR family transcriptional regulator [Burkholderia sp. Ac-20365]